MSLSRREFLQVLAAGTAAGFALDAPGVLAAERGAELYDVPRYGNVHLLHFTDCHAQLLPVYFREPSVNLGVGRARNRAPHIVGEQLLRAFGVRPKGAEAHALTYLDFEAAAATYGRVGGFAHLATLVKQLRASRPAALLLDGGDTWQGSATALWTKGQDMVDAAKLLGVDMMSAHWEFTLGAERVKEIIDKDFKGKVEFLAQNVRTTDFGDPVFKGYAMREMNGVRVAVIGQAFPYTPIANPRWMVPDWTFGIQDDTMQETVTRARTEGAQVVVVLSHNGMDVDVKMAGRVTGIDVILGGHTHDAVPQPVPVRNAKGHTLVANSGSNGKFLSVLDFDVRGGKLKGWRYKLLPVFSNLLPADKEMAAHIESVRAPHKAKLEEQLAVTEGLLYRRGNFNGTWDQLILDALMEVKGAQIAFSPGFRWGTTLLPGQPITFEHVMDQTAITYPASTLTDMSGEMIKTILEDVGDNLFNPDPYYQQGGDMVRVGGLTYACDPHAAIGKRILDMRLDGKPIEPNKTYKVAGWAPVAEGASGEPVWDVVAGWLRNRRTVTPRQLNTPRLIGVSGNRGIA
ncbi:MAG: thiosulfohydrolase SoxB [Betaproteobacteria bacterium]|nr:thiosulfohydrolase SoxB [Betaproteobacteria bacterium]